MKLIDLVGQEFGRLTVSERAANSYWGKPQWRCLCECGGRIIVPGQSLRRGLTRSCGCLGREARIERNSKEVVSYEGMHQRIRRLRGQASAHPCVDCNSPAQEWAYDNADPEERESTKGRFSLDHNHYQPRCKKCHAKFDRQAKKDRN